jgi:hypothetical protein
MHGSVHTTPTSGISTTYQGQGAGADGLSTVSGTISRAGHMPWTMPLSHEGCESPCFSYLQSAVIACVGNPVLSWEDAHLCTGAAYRCRYSA